MMKSLTGSCSKAIIDKSKFYCFNDLPLNRSSQLRLVPWKNVAGIKLSQLLSLQQRRRLQHVLSSPESQVESETTETQPEQEIPSKTINVKFQLHKECSFGEHFFIVGDHPMLGSWDPENAVSLTWSEGHVWGVELDIPVGTSIKFKFILETSPGVLLWQPDPDRMFECRETENTVVVCEDWEDGEHQKVMEEEPMMADQDGPLLDSETMIVQALSGESATVHGEPSLEKALAIAAENISHPTEDLVANADDGVVGSKGINCLDDDEALYVSNKNVMVAEDIGDVEANLVAHEGDSPVLVPGLSPLATVSTEEAILGVDEKHGATEETILSVDENDSATEEETTAIAKTEEEQVDQHIQEPLVAKVEEEQVKQYIQEPLIAKEEQPDLEAPQSNVLQSDVRWGRMTLRKLFDSFRFP